MLDPGFRGDTCCGQACQEAYVAALCHDASKEELDGAKKSGLSPYPILRKMYSYNRDSVQYYIASGGSAPVKYESVADYLVDREIELNVRDDDYYT